MFQNKEVKWILPTRGGVGVAGILPYLDFQIIAQNPKIISGYSDITVLLNVLYEYADLIASTVCCSLISIQIRHLIISINSSPQPLP